MLVVERGNALYSKLRKFIHFPGVLLALDVTSNAVSELSVSVAFLLC